MKKTIFPNGKPFIKDGNTVIPDGIVWPGETEPRLTVREWWYLFWRGFDEPSVMKLKEWVGGTTTVWRVRKSLKEKGFLE